MNMPAFENRSIFDVMTLRDILLLSREKSPESNDLVALDNFIEKLFEVSFVVISSELDENIKRARQLREILYIKEWEYQEKSAKGFQFIEGDITLIAGGFSVN